MTSETETKLLQVLERIERRLAAEEHADAEAVPIPEAARRLNCGRTTIYKLVKAGKLKKLNAGGRPLITVDSIRAHLGVETPKPKAPPRPSRSDARALAAELRAVKVD